MLVHITLQQLTKSRYQFAIGRLVNGLGIGALSVLVPMYQSESSPAIIRGVLVASYQLFITLGIWTAEMVDWGTSENSNSSSWRIPNGLSFLWAIILGVGILFLPESPVSQIRIAKAAGSVSDLFPALRICQGSCGRVPCYFGKTWGPCTRQPRDQYLDERHSCQARRRDRCRKSQMDRAVHRTSYVLPGCSWCRTSGRPTAYWCKLRESSFLHGCALGY